MRNGDNIHAKFDYEEYRRLHYCNAQILFVLHSGELLFHRNAIVCLSRHWHSGIITFVFFCPIISIAYSVGIAP